MLIKKKKKKKRLKKKLKCNIPFDECETLGWDREGALQCTQISCFPPAFQWPLFSSVTSFPSSYCQQEQRPQGWGLFYISGVLLVLIQGLFCPSWLHRVGACGPKGWLRGWIPTPVSPHAKEVPVTIIVVMTLFPNSLLRQQCKPVVKHTIHYGHPQTEAKLE